MSLGSRLYLALLANPYIAFVWGIIGLPVLISGVVKTVKTATATYPVRYCAIKNKWGGCQDYAYYDVGNDQPSTGAIVQLVIGFVFCVLYLTALVCTIRRYRRTGRIESPREVFDGVFGRTIAPAPNTSAPALAAVPQLNVAGVAAPLPQPQYYKYEV
ncbi:hypothetical protein JCM10207_007108 [Rhodosporidiobolus poonsookiae]